MKENVRFYKCKNCENVIGLIHGNSENISCCGEKMELLHANSTDAATEKHIPFVNIEDNTLFISVGEVLHPMTDEHYISRIYVLDDLGNMQKISLNSSDTPEVSVRFNENAKKLKIYSYCNLHGLWKKEIDL